MQIRIVHSFTWAKSADKDPKKKLSVVPIRARRQPSSFPAPTNTTLAVLAPEKLIRKHSPVVLLKLNTNGYHLDSWIEHHPRCRPECSELYLTGMNQATGYIRWSKGPPTAIRQSSHDGPLRAACASRGSGKAAAAAPVVNASAKLASKPPASLPCNV